MAQPALGVCSWSLQVSNIPDLVRLSSEVGAEVVQIGLGDPTHGSCRCHNTTQAFAPPDTLRHHQHLNRENAREIATAGSVRRHKISAATMARDATHPYREHSNLRRTRPCPAPSQGQPRHRPSLRCQSHSDHHPLPSCARKREQSRRIFSGTGLETETVEVRRTLLLVCLLYTSPSPRDGLLSRMPSSA
mgnify:CR=1 FL=1